MDEQRVREIIAEEVSNKVSRVTMTVNEAAAYVGVHPDTIRDLVRKKEIPHSRLNTRIMFRKGSLDKWMDEQEAKNCQPA